MLLHLTIILALSAHVSLAKPTNCVVLCDEQQNYMRPQNNVYNGFGRSTYGLPSGKLENLDVGFVQPGNYMPSGGYQTGYNGGYQGVMPMNYNIQPSHHLMPMAQQQVETPMIKQSPSLEALFHQSQSSSSSSSSSSLGYIRQYPVNHVAPMVQHEPLRSSVDVCSYCG